MTFTKSFHVWTRTSNRLCWFIWSLSYHYWPFTGCYTLHSHVNCVFKTFQTITTLFIQVIYRQPLLLPPSAATQPLLKRSDYSFFVCVTCIEHCMQKTAKRKRANYVLEWLSMRLIVPLTRTSSSISNSSSSSSEYSSSSAAVGGGHG